MGAEEHRRAEKREGDGGSGRATSASLVKRRFPRSNVLTGAGPRKGEPIIHWSRRVLLEGRLDGGADEIRVGA